MTHVDARLEAVGEALHRAWSEDVARQRRSLLPRQGRVAIVAAVVIAAAVAGGAIASGLLKSEADEERGLVQGHSLFEGSTPTCVSRTANSFRCTLERPPTGMTFYDEDGRVVRDRFLGTKFQTVDASRRIDGGCVAVSDDGRAWDCYLGREAVERGIIGPDLLGVYQPQRASG